MIPAYPLRALGEMSVNHDARRVPVKAADRKSGPYPYYGAQGIVDYVDDYIFDGVFLLVAEDGENLRSRNEDIAFMASGKFWVNNHAHILRASSDAATRFLKYAVNSSDISGYITGSTIPKLSQRSLHSILIPCPPDAAQEEIVSLLGALDDKIDLNFRMNDTLEAMARAIFKDWFVDFGPTRAKAEGREPYLPPRVWKLFPSALNDEEKPVGWEVRRLAELVELAYGKSLPAKSRVSGNVRVYGSGGVTGTHNAALIDGPAVIVGRKGTVGSLYWEDGPAFPIDTVFYVVPRIGSMLFSYHALSFQPLRDMNTDAAVPGLNRNNVYRLEFTMPPSPLLSIFDEVVGPIWRLRGNNLKELQTLTETRNFLQPKLVSGALRIRSADKFIASAV